MKETKVYTGRRNGKHAELMQKLDKTLKEKHFAFVFSEQELKEHNRELVKEVCDEIKNETTKMYYAEDQEDDSIEQAIVVSRNEAVDEFIDILDRIQKEFEK